MINLDTLTAGLKRGFADALEEIISWHMSYAEVTFSVGRLAKETRYSPRWMRYGFLALEDAGHLKRIERPGQPNIYVLIGRAAEYLQQLRALRAKKARAKAETALAYVRRVAGAASKAFTPALSAPNSSLHHKEREEVALTVEEQAIVHNLKSTLGGEGTHVPLSQLYARNNPRL